MKKKGENVNKHFYYDHSIQLSKNSPGVTTKKTKKILPL